MGALVTALIIVVAIVFLLSLMFVVLRRRPAPESRRTTTVASPHAPVYRAQAEHAEYYRPGETKSPPVAPPSIPKGRDPRKEPLPHCPLCNAAVGFDDARCPKCGHVLRET